MLRTEAAGEYCESIIRQRCGCKTPSSDAEGGVGPNTARRIEHVHSIESYVAIYICATHQQSAAAAAAQLAILPLPKHRPLAITDINTYDALEPPANIASP